MKTVRFAYAIFIMLFIAVLANCFVLDNIFSDIEAMVIEADTENMENAESIYANIYEEYKQKELYISLTVSHEDLTDLENCFSEIIGAAKAGDMESVIITKSRLSDRLRHIRRLSGINIDSIF